MDEYGRHLENRSVQGTCPINDEEDLTDEECLIQGIEPELEDTFDPSEEEEEEYFEPDEDGEIPSKRTKCSMCHSAYS